MKLSILVLLSFVFAAMFMIIPLPDWLAWFRPDWLMLVLCVWILLLPQQIGFAVAWVCGLIADLLSSSLLGEHAFAFVLVTYIVFKLHRQVRLFPVWQQATVVLILALFMQMSLTLVQITLGQASNFWFWLTSIVDALCWPIIWGGMNICLRRISTY